MASRIGSYGCHSAEPRAASTHASQSQAAPTAPRQVPGSQRPTPPPCREAHRTRLGPGARSRWESGDPLPCTCGAAVAHQGGAGLTCGGVGGAEAAGSARGASGAPRRNGRVAVRAGGAPGEEPLTPRPRVAVPRPAAYPQRPAPERGAGRRCRRSASAAATRCGSAARGAVGSRRGRASSRPACGPAWRRLRGRAAAGGEERREEQA